MMSRATLQIFVHAICCAKVKSDVDPIKELDKHDIPPAPPPSEEKKKKKKKRKGKKIKKAGGNKADL